MASERERAAALKEVFCYPWNLELLSPELRADEEVVLMAVAGSGLALRHADPALKADRNFMLKVLQCAGSALEFAAEPLRNDREVVLTAVSHTGMAAAYASKALRDDRELMLVAVRQQGAALRDVSQRLRQDRDLVCEAVKQNGMALMYAQTFQEDEEIALEALRTAPNAFRHVSPKVRNSKLFMLQAVQYWGCLIKLAADDLQSDWDVVLRAVRQDPTAMDATPGMTPCDTAIRLQCEPLLVAAIGNAIACTGEEAPVVEVQKLGPSLGASCDGNHYTCEALLLSGRALSCSLDQKASLNDLALALRQCIPLEERQRIYLTFQGRAPVDPLDGFALVSDYCC